MKIKKDDKVKVIAGSDKGKEGKVLLVLPRADRVLVEGINMKNRRERPRKQRQKGQTVKVAHPIHISNVKVVTGGEKKTKAKK